MASVQCFSAEGLHFSALVEIGTLSKLESTNTIDSHLETSMPTAPVSPNRPFSAADQTLLCLADLLMDLST